MLKHLQLLLILAASVTITLSCHHQPTSSVTPQEMPIATTSMAVDTQMLHTLLNRLSVKIGPSFNQNHIDQVFALVTSMSVNETRPISFSISFEGKTVPLGLSIFKDDIDAPDTEFSSSPDV